MKKLIYLFLTFFGVILYSVSSYSQDIDCGLKLTPQEEIEYVNSMDLMKKFSSKKRTKAPATYTIPIVFHILTDPGITQADMLCRINDAIRILNEDFNGTNAGFNTTDPRFDAIKATMSIEFCAAVKDPQGNTLQNPGMNWKASENITDGYDSRIYDHMWWGVNNTYYMDVTVVSDPNSTGTTGSGHAFLPTQNVVPHISYNYRYIGETCGSLAPGSGTRFGSVMTHEVGHYLGLRHVFNDGCTGDGDGIADTPLTTGSEGCGHDFMGACGNYVNLENYMDYNVNCTNMFTQDQVDVMTGWLTDGATASYPRNSLWQAANLEAVGCSSITSTDPPIANFTWTPTAPAYNTNVSFTDASVTVDPITTWAWTFDGATTTTSNQQNPTNIQWPNGGTFDVTLTVTNSHGSHTVTKQITVTGPLAPVPDFTVNGFDDASLADIVINSPVTFVSTTTTNAPITVWSWTFQNGDVTTASTEAVPQITWDTPGTYDITLTVTNSVSTETITKTITVRLPNVPVALFTAIPTTINEGETVTFTDASTSETSILTWVWDFPGASSITTFTGQTPPAIQYDVAGTYTVTLTVTNEGGQNVQTVVDVITVNKVWALPVADFQATTATNIQEGESVTFEDLSTGEIESWSWTFTGGFPSTYTTDGSPPAITYQTAGTYPVTLTVTNPGGSDTHTITSYIVVGALVSPTAIWEADGNGALNPITVAVGATVQFTDLSTPVGTILTWDWALTGALPTSYTNTDQNPTATYPVAGTFPVRLTVTNGANPNSDLVQINGFITVVNAAPPTADFNTTATTITAGGTINFTDNSNDNGFAITAYNWDFDGGAPATASTVGPHNITFDTPGTYDVVLTVTNANGSDTHTVTITVDPVGSAPIADFTPSATTITTGETVTFTNASNDNGTPITSYSWDFDSNSPASATTVGPHTVTFNTAGTYDVVLTVDNGSGTDTKTVTITVTDGSAPIAGFTTSVTSINTGQTVTFTDDSNDNGSAITSYNWDFDGNLPANATTVGPHTVTFNTAGTYDVVLTVTNAVGSDSHTIQIIVSDLGGPPTADFTSSATTVGIGGTLTFTDASNDNGSPITGYDWTFNGGTPTSSSTVGPHAVTFSNAGTYDIVLSVTNAQGNDSHTIQLTVGDLPTADFTVSATTINMGETITFTDASLDGGLTITGYDWTFSGGAPNNSSVVGPHTVTFNAAGSYDIELTVTNAIGSNTHIVTVTVLDPGGPPVADFTMSLATINIGQPVTFTDFSNDNGATITAYDWDFGTGSTPATETTIGPHTVTFNTAGTITISLTITNQNGSDTKTRTITVLDPGGPPTANFTLSPSATIDMGQTITFTNTSTDGGSTITGYAWIFNGGIPTSSTSQNPLPVTYNTAGTFDAELTVTNANGSHTYTVSITVNDPSGPPTANITASATNINTGQTINFSDASLDNGSAITTWDWQIAGGTPATSTSQDAGIVTFSTSGTYDVTLTVTNALGSDSYTMQVTVVDLGGPPLADIFASTTNIVVGQSVSFSDASLANGNAISNWDWSFTIGTPATSTLQNPGVVQFNTAGTHDVTLTVTNVNGTDTKTIQIVVSASGNAPTADITPSATTITTGGTITFTDASTPNGSAITSLDWAFGTGTPSTANTVGPHVITFNTLGTHDVTLTVTNAVGTDTKTIQITVSDLPVVADFTASPSTTINEGQTINFTDASSGNITSWNWTFNNATPASSTSQVPGAITYATPGTYDVILEVSDGSNTDSKTIQVTVNPNPPVADFTISPGLTVEQGGSLTFADASTGYNITGYSWIFGSGTPANANAVGPHTVIFDTQGSFDVTLAVTNGGGTTEKTVTINVTPPGALTAEFNVQPNTVIPSSVNKVVIGETITFTDASVSQLPISTYTWTFDGGTPTSANTVGPHTITFNAAGTYDVTLLVDNGSDTDTKVFSIEVIEPLVPDFTASVVNVTAGGTIDFTDQSTSPTPVTAWNWTFTGAVPTNSNVQNPTGITYNIPGTYEVALTVTNADQTETVIKTAYIIVDPSVNILADFFANVTTISEGEIIDFTDNSTTTGSAITAWLWEIEGGTPTTSTDQNPSGIVFNAAGTYKVKLTVTSPDGSASEEKLLYITVTPRVAPTADFEIVGNITTIGTAMCLDFSDLSTSSSPITSWLWEFEGGTPATSTDQNPRGITYPTAGVYKVKLTVTNADVLNDAKEVIGVVNVEGPSAAPYCDAQRTSDCQCVFEYIANVEMTEVNGPTHIDNATTCGNFSQHLTAASGNLMTLKEYDLKIDVGNSSVAAPYIRAYIDWNNDKDFDELNEEYFLINDISTASAARRIKIPEDAVVGTPIRMRIRVQFFSPVQPCGDSEYGEIEDYEFSIDYNPLTTVNEESDRSDLAKIFPNPSSGKLFFQFDNVSGDPVNIKVLDASGRLIVNQTILTSKNKSTYEIDLSTISEGLYNILLTDDKTVINKKIIITK